MLLCELCVCNVVWVLQWTDSSTIGQIGAFALRRVEQAANHEAERVMVLSMGAKTAQARSAKHKIATQTTAQVTSTRFSCSRLSSHRHIGCVTKDTFLIPKHLEDFEFHQNVCATTKIQVLDNVLIR